MGTETAYFDAELEHGHEYPPAEWTKAELAEALATSPAEFPLPRYDDEETWAAVESDPLTGTLATAIRTRAATLAEQERTPPTAINYMSRYRDDIDKTEDWDAPRHVLVEAGTLALAECLDREGEYLDAILNRMWAVCEASTWLGPFHLTEPRNEDRHIEGLPRSLEPEEHQIDLHAAWIVKNLAEIDYALGDRLHPGLRERLREEIEKRAFRTYEANDLHWMAGHGNWNPVCNNGVLAGAMHLLEDTDRIASMVHKGVASLRYYIDAFGANGLSHEGVGYGDYGFFNYLELATNLEARTGGEYSLLSPPVVEETARVPDRTELSPDLFPAFGDTHELIEFTPFMCCKLGEYFGIEELVGRGHRTLRKQLRESPDSYGGARNHFSSGVRNLIWCRGESDTGEQGWGSKPAQFYFDDIGWWVARNAPSDPDGLTIAAKGGHNQQGHNHNDTGSFVVHYRGESLLTDPGGPGGYSHEYFSADRYAHLAARSLGHSVPYVNGVEQAPGDLDAHSGWYGSEVLEVRSEDDTEVFELDLAGCYPDEALDIGGDFPHGAGLSSLRRRFALERGNPGRITLEDRATFTEDASGRDVESIFVSYFPMATTEDGFEVTGDRSRATVTAVDGPVDVEIEQPQADPEDDSESNWDRLYEDVPLRRARVTASDDSGADTVTRRFDISLSDR